MDEDFWSWIVIIWIVLFCIWFFLWWESEWYIKDIDSCKETIYIEDHFRNRIFTRYTCTYERDDNWKKIWWICAKINLNDNWICTKANVYNKKFK